LITTILVIYLEWYQSNLKIMKTKNILFSIIFFMALASCTHFEKEGLIASESAVTAFKVKAENLDELKNFDWETVKEMFKENDEDQEITLEFEFVNNAPTVTSKKRLDNFTFKLTGKTSHIDNMTSKLKRMVDKIADVEEIEITIKD
jgi:hypothetical protein